MIPRRAGIVGPIAVVVTLLVMGAAFMLSYPRERAAGGRESGPAAAPGALVARAAPRSAEPSRTGPARVAVPFAEKAPVQPLEGAPPGWTLKEFVGQADVELQRAEGGRMLLRLRSDGSSFAVYRDVLVDPHELPLLSWTWKAMRLPSGGDVRIPSRDDQAAQIYVIFPRWPSPITNSDVIGYIWDTNAPLGARVTSPRAGNVKLIVVESGNGNLGQWVQYQRNVLDDYVALFGKKPPRVGKIALMIDSNDTASAAEALWGSVAFERPR